MSQTSGRELRNNHYVAGFVFNESRNKVVLIRKNKPAWQNGKLNAVGGRIEAEESPYDAMRREFHEETGNYVHGWEPTVILGNECDWKVTFFRRIMDDVTFRCIQWSPGPTAELIVVADYPFIRDLLTIRNLPMIAAISADDTVAKPVVLRDTN